jgi:hypothetical protein
MGKLTFDPIKILNTDGKEVNLVQRFIYLFRRKKMTLNKLIKLSVNCRKFYTTTKVLFRSTIKIKKNLIVGP